MKTYYVTNNKTRHELFKLLLNQGWESYFLKVTRYRYSLSSKKSNSLPLLVTYF